MVSLLNGHYVTAAPASSEQVASKEADSSKAQPSDLEGVAVRSQVQQVCFSMVTEPTGVGTAMHMTMLW